MTEMKPKSGDEPKKKSLKLLLRSRPAAEVDTSVGHIYLYPLRVRDMTDFGKLEPGDTVTQLRNILCSIAGLNVESNEATERIPLDPEIANSSPTQDYEISEANLLSS